MFNIIVRVEMAHLKRQKLLCDLLVENRVIFIPRLYLVPLQGGGDPVGISWRCLMLVKLEWLRVVKKLRRLC